MVDRRFGHPQAGDEADPICGQEPSGNKVDQAIEALGGMVEPSSPEKKNEGALRDYTAEGGTERQGFEVRDVLLNIVLVDGEILARQAGHRITLTVDYSEMIGTRMTPERMGCARESLAKYGNSVTTSAGARVREIHLALSQTSDRGIALHHRPRWYHCESFRLSGDSDSSSARASASACRVG